MMERKCAPDIDQLGVVADPYKLAFEYTFGMGIRQIDLSMGIKVITDAMFVDDSSPRDFPREEKITASCDLGRNSSIRGCTRSSSGQDVSLASAWAVMGCDSSFESKRQSDADLRSQLYLLLGFIYALRCDWSPMSRDMKEAIAAWRLSEDARRFYYLARTQQRDMTREEAHAAIHEAEIRADRGDSWSLCLLGWMYDKGKGKPLDPSKAVRLYAKSAIQGNATGEYNLGVCYESGHGVKKDMLKAIKYYQAASKQGNTWAQYNLALCHASGEGVSRDASKAAELLQQAADQGDAWAMNALALAFERGNGVPRNPEKGLEYYSRSADRGCAAGQYNLALCYKYGSGGVSQDRTKMYELFTRAAEQGSEAAKYSLARCYANESGLLKQMQTVVLYEYGVDASNPKEKSEIVNLQKAVEVYAAVIEECTRTKSLYPFASRALVNSTRSMYWKTIRLIWTGHWKGSQLCIFNRLPVCVMEYLVDFCAPTVPQTLRD
jgi:TPR repeat protein